MEERSVELDGEDGVGGRMPPGGGMKNPRSGLDSGASRRGFQEDDVKS